MQGAGGGRQQKPKGQSRNHHPLARDPVAVPAGENLAVDGPPNPIVALDEVGETIWRQIWAAPSASQWRSGDVPALTRLVWLEQSPERWLDPRLLAEMRQLEDRFGLNAYARRQLKWEDETPAPAPAPGRPVKAAPRGKPPTMRVLAGGQS